MRDRNKIHKQLNSKSIKSYALELGFSVVGIARAEFLADPAKNLNHWLDNGYHATMQWVENRKTERSDIHTYFPEAKSVISLGMNYFTGNAISGEEYGKISNYAWGDDYHDVLKTRLRKLLKFIQTSYPNVQSRVCVDTSPVMDKVWAQRAGLGWQGKHTNLINREYGSWLFLGELILDIELDYDQPFSEDLCGTCTACIDDCPTNALTEYQINSNKCISYLTIEHRGDLPENYQDQLNSWIYGCDICQEVCPWNIKFGQTTDEDAFKPREDIQNRKLTNWKNLIENEFRVLFKNSAVKRTKYAGLYRNIINVSNSVGSKG